MAEIQIKDLLDTINKDGIKKGEEERDRIIAEARKKAEEIVADARKEADEIVRKALLEKDVFVSQGEVAVRQAAGNAVIDLKKQLNGMISSVICRKLHSELGGDGIVSLVKEAMKQIPDRKLVLELSEKAVKFASSALADEIKNGLEISIRDASGFRLAEKDGSGYYDFSEKELIALISPYLSGTLEKAVAGKETK